MKLKNSNGEKKKLKNSNCDETQKLKFWYNSKTLIVMKLKNTIDGTNEETETL